MIQNNITAVLMPFIILACIVILEGFMEAIDKMATTSFAGLLKESFRIWKQGWLSFILSEILLFIALAFLLTPTIATAHYFGVVRETSPAFLNPILASVTAIIGIIFQSLVIGSFVGLGKELIEFEDTRAENTLYYVKNHGLQFIMVGMIIAALIFIPLTLVRIILGFATNFERVRGLGIIIFPITFFLVAPFTLAIPAAVIDGKNSIDALKTSIKLFRNDTKTVLGLFGFFAIIGFVLLSPTLALTTRNAILTHRLIPEFTAGIIGVIPFICSLFVIFPLMCITLTRLYYDYKAPETKESCDEGSPISLF